MAGTQVALTFSRRAPALLGSAACHQRIAQQETCHSARAFNPSAAQAPRDWAAAKSPFLGARRSLSKTADLKMAKNAAAQRGSSRASLAESTPAVLEQAYQQPIAKGAPLKLDKETLQMALNAALLSSLAYKTPLEVEYLRLRANRVSQEEARKTIQRQAGGTMPEELNTTEKVKALEEDNDKHKYTDILSQFDEPSQYFDGRQSLFMDTTEAYVFFCPNPSEGQRKVLYCVFRGTSDDGDKLADLDFAQVQIAPMPPTDAPEHVADIKNLNIKIHRGFRDQFVAVSTALTRNVEAAAREVLEQGGAVAPGPATRMKDMVKAKVAKEADLDGEGFEVVVAGHSLGAALATIGSFVAAVEHPGVRVSFFGFGSPRVGNGHFVEAFNRVLPRSRVHHFANHRDIVTGIPGPMFFRHVPGSIMLSEEGNKVRAFALADETGGIRSTNEWLWNSAEFVNWWLWKQLGKVPWSQHDVSLYIKRVRALLDEAKAGK